MEELKDRLSFLRKQSRKTQEELAKELNVSDKVISKWEKGGSEPSLADLRNIAKIFGVSFDYLIDGKPNQHDLLIINRRLTPDEKADDFLKQCYKIVRNRNYLKLKDKLIPQKKMVFSKRDNKDVFVGFEGGIFKYDVYYQWEQVYTPYVDIKKLLALDDYDIYKAFIDLPATFGELRYQLKKNKDEEGLKATQPVDNSREPWTYEEPKKSLTAEDIIGLTDYRFAKEIDDQRELNEALELLDPNLKTYWYWVKALIEKGAMLQKVVGYSDYGECDVFGDDVPSTKLLLEEAKRQTKE